MQYGAHALCGSHSCPAALPVAALFCRMRRIGAPHQTGQLGRKLLGLLLRLLRRRLLRRRLLLRLLLLLLSLLLC